MALIKASDITPYTDWNIMVYGSPGTGKTKMVESMTGKTLVLSIDGMYSVLSGLEDVDIYVMDTSQPDKDLGAFYKLSRDSDYTNVVIDNLSTFQKVWLNSRAKTTTSGMPEIKDYAIIDRITFDFIKSISELPVNSLFIAHEKAEERVHQNGTKYEVFVPDLRQVHSLMGILPLVGRLISFKKPESEELEREIVLQPTQKTKAKDQLNVGKATVKQMELIPLLNK